MATTFDELLKRLRAAAEPTRLRLLAACADGELTVGELCRVIAQSQPRVSRHLKLLCDAGLLVRFREEHCVYYRTPMRSAGAETVKQLLESLASDDAVIARDRTSAAEVRDLRTRGVLTASGTGDVAADAADQAIVRQALLEEMGAGPVGDLLDIGTGTGRVLRWLAPNAAQAVGVDLASDALRVARTYVHGAGLRHCLLRKGDMYELPFQPASFDTVTMDHLLADAQRPADALREAARMLKPEGRLVVIEDFDGLELRGDASHGHPLATLRFWLAEAGIDCQRLRPVECASCHLLLAVCRPAAHVVAAA